MKTRLEDSMNNREYKIIQMNKRYPPYYDDGYVYHKSGGSKNKKRLTQVEVRQYKSWKYNRKHQYHEYES